MALIEKRRMGFRPFSVENLISSVIFGPPWLAVLGSFAEFGKRESIFPNSRKTHIRNP